MPTYVGVLTFISKFLYGVTERGTQLFLFKPYNDKIPEFIVACSKCFNANQIALISTELGDITLRLTMGSKRPRGNLLHLFGSVGDIDAEKKALLFHYGSPVAFKHMKSLIDTSFDGHRIEISAATGWCVYHVGAASSQAIAYHPETRETAITISDASISSENDAYVKARGMTFYNLDGTVEMPMMHDGTLKVGTRARGLTLIIDSTGIETLILSWITVARQFTEEEYDGPAAMNELLFERYNAAILHHLNGAGIYRYTNPIDSVWCLLDKRLNIAIQEAAHYTEAYSEGSTCSAIDPLNNYADLVNQRIVKHVITWRPNTEDCSSIAIHMNERMQANRLWLHDLTLLTKVVPGHIHTVNVMWLDNELIWIPEWLRVIKARHSRPIHPDTSEPVLYDRVILVCDMSKPSWKTRVITTRA